MYSLRTLKLALLLKGKSINYLYQSKKNDTLNCAICSLSEKMMPYEIYLMDSDILS